MSPTIQSSESQLRIKFFDLIFGENEGYVCVAAKNPALPRAGFTQKFFNWPTDYMKMEEHILRLKSSRDMYYCVNLLTHAERKKEFCKAGDLIWADLDEVDPKTLETPAPIVIQSSTGRYQAIWRCSTNLTPTQSEDYSKRMAYHIGADKSGWDLTQLLRIPFTFNFKHDPPQRVELLAASEAQAPSIVFETLPLVDQPGAGDDDWIDVPSEEDLAPVEAILYKYSQSLLTVDFKSLYTMELSPSDDWSRPLWKLIHVCLEAGMNENETFVIAKTSSLNKYDRDNRPVSHLWGDIRKAKKKQENLHAITDHFIPVKMPLLVDLDYEPESSFITDYRSWAEESTDAVPQFHDLSSFILLSSIVANSVRLETSYGAMVPNIWGMILGDSTLSRKTTAMRMIMDILNTMNSDMILATDGSAEGLLGGLELRPNRTSIFFRDELSGFFDGINRKDYLAGLPETFTHLYDVPSVYTRRLRKEVIRLENPIFIFFGGGVREKVYEVCTEEYVTSGFLPRFLVVSGDTDLSRLRRTGPANDIGIEKRAKIVSRVADLHDTYATEVIVKIGGQPVSMPPRVMAKLTPQAWADYGVIEESLVVAGDSSSIPHLALPTFERLSRSILKMSCLLAAARQEPKDNSIEVTPADVKNAAWYGQQWGPFSLDLIMNTGKGVTEKLLDKIVKSIKEHPGVLRSTIMQHHHLTKRQADEVLSTLEERMIVQAEKRGRGYAYWAI